MKYFVIINDSTGEAFGRVFAKQVMAINQTRNLNAMDYDMPQGGPGGWMIVPVEAPVGTPEAKITDMAKSIKKGKGQMESKTYFNRYLGNDDVAEYTKTVSKGMTEASLEEAYNDYFQGDTADFKKKMKTVSEVAQFTSYLIENGTDVRLINQMLKTLA